MKTNRVLLVLVVIVFISTVLVGAIAAAGLPWPPPEEWDLDILRQRDPAQAQEALRMLGTTGLLLIPDVLNDRVMAFDPTTGDLVDPNFVPADPTHLQLPSDVILSPSGNSLLISETSADVVFEYDLLGNFVGVFAPAGGPDLNILSANKGMALRSNGNLLVAVLEDANANAVAEFDTNGNYLGNFIEPGTGGLFNPFDIYQRSGDWLVSSSSNGKVVRFALETGDLIGDLAPIDTTPFQLAETSTGNILVANFLGEDKGIVELTSAGGLVDIYDPVAAYVGVYELPNDNLLISTPDGVFEISRAGALVDTKIDGVDARFIEYISLAADFSNSSKEAPATADSGSQFTYTLVIDNSGIITATTTSLVDPIPAGLTYVNGSATGGAVFVPTQNQIKWVGDVGPNSAVTITFEVEVTAESGWITNIATIDHSSITAVEVSATTNILPAGEADFEIYLPIVLKSE